MVWMVFKDFWYLVHWTKVASALEGLTLLLLLLLLLLVVVVVVVVVVVFSTRLPLCFGPWYEFISPRYHLRNDAYVDATVIMLDGEFQVFGER